MNALVAGNGSYIVRPCGHDLHGLTQGTPHPRLDGIPPPPPSARRALATRRVVCLLRSRRRTFLYLFLSARGCFSFSRCFPNNRNRFLHIICANLSKLNCNVLKLSDFVCVEFTTFSFLVQFSYIKKSLKHIQMNLKQCIMTILTYFNSKTPTQVYSLQ